MNETILFELRGGICMKRFLKILLVSVMCLTIAGCGTEYEDSNGADDFSLQTITDENIINLETGSSGLTYSEKKLAGVSSSEYSAKNFNGVEQIYLENYVTPSDIHVYIGHMNVESGNFRLVVINNDEIIHEFPLDTFNEEILFEDLEGTFSVHVAGESAAFDFHIEIY